MTERTLFPEVPGPLMLLRRQRTKPHSVTQRRQARITSQIRVDRNPICALPTTAPKLLSLRPLGDDLNHGQSQKALQSDNGSGAAEGHAKHEAAGDDLNHGQSQKALHESDNGSGAAKGHAKHEAPEHGSNHGQSQKSPQETDNGSSRGCQRGTTQA